MCIRDSVYTAQGYLTLSLPVRAEAVVASKCLVALIWLLLLLLVGAASVAVCLLIGVPQDFWREFSQQAVYAMRYLRANIWQFGSFPWACLLYTSIRRQRARTALRARTM